MRLGSYAAPGLTLTLSLTSPRGAYADLVQPYLTSCRVRVNLVQG